MTEAWKTEEDDTPVETDESGYGPIEILDVVDTPPPSMNSLYTEVIQSLIEAQDEEAKEGFKWRAISTGGRQKNTVQSGLTTAAARFGVKVETKTAEVNGQPRVYVRLKDVGKEGEAATEEETTEEK